MAWPYHHLDLSHEEKLIRRHALDRYGSYAQLSALIPVILYQIYLLAVWLSTKRQRSKTDYSAVPSSPTLKNARLRTTGSIASRYRRAKWWLASDVVKGWGSRGEWVFSVGWSTWLLFLCVHETGEDYMHLTKRFGIIAASQFPVHYMLSMKSLYSPMALAFRASHEELNHYHRMLGRIVYGLLILHASFYLNYFIQVSVLLKRLQDRDVILGLIGLSLMSALMSTAFQAVRRWSYRVFFLVHISVGVSLLPILFFHVTHLRLYIIESLVLFTMDIISRRLDTFTAFSKITAAPNTSLVKLSIPIPASSMKKFDTAPGQHIYLSLPTESASNPIHQLLFNPFTIAGISENQMTLVLRVLNGPSTNALNALLKLPKANPPLKIEGPYGASRRFPNFATDYDRILLIAGGVGATFILPIFKDLQGALANEGVSTKKVEMIWSMKSRDEANWVDGVEALEKDLNLRIYITGTAEARAGSADIPYDGLEMTASNAGGRPDLNAVVNAVFRHGEEERVAVLVCGPHGMAAEVRIAVGRWVEKGRSVWFHDENFGW